MIELYTQTTGKWKKANVAANAQRMPINPRNEVMSGNRVSPAPRREPPIAISTPSTAQQRQHTTQDVVKFRGAQHGDFIGSKKESGQRGCYAAAAGRRYGDRRLP